MNPTMERVLERRWATAVVLLILTALGLLATVASRWTNDVLFNTDTWVETVGPLGTDEAVVDALSNKASTALTTWLDAEHRLEDLLPPNLAPLATLAAPWINDKIDEATVDFFESNAWETVWVDINRVGHRAIVAVIKDQLPFVSTAGGNVTIDLEPVLTPIADRVFDRLSDLEQAIPQALLDRVNIDDTINDIIQTYQQEGIPDDLRTIEVYQSDRLAAVQQTASLLDRLTWVLPIVTLILGAGAIYFAPSRWLMTVLLLGSAAVAWVLGWASVRLIVNSVVDSIESDGGAAVAEAVFEGVTNGLTTLLVWLAVIAGLASIGLGWWLYRTSSQEEATSSPVA